MEVATDTALLADMQQIFNVQQAHQYALARTTAGMRIAKLKRLHRAMLDYAEDIYRAMDADLRKCRTEVDISEIGVVNTEIRHTIRHLRRWMAPQAVDTPMALIGNSSEIRYEPKGVCLIISPWNFPLNLALAPLCSAVAAGNCVILKPSEFTPNSNQVLRKIVAACFPPEEVSIFEGDAQVAQQLLQLPFNHIFFTGSPEVGKIVMREASRHLASVTLELGGKSPTIIDETADLDTSLRTIAALKILNAGQICIAPDYLLVHESIQEEVVRRLSAIIQEFYGQTPEARRASPDMCRIISERHFDRLAALQEDALQGGAQLAFGGKHVRSERYIEPTLLTAVPQGARIMQEEIFGPLLPIMSYRNLDEVIAMINSHPRALAMYIFSRNNKNIENLIGNTRNGGVVVNNCGNHFYNTNLPFGGINNSGIGKAHGHFGFLEFSHARGIMRQGRWIMTTRFVAPPYGRALTKWLLEGVKRIF